MERLVVPTHGRLLLRADEARRTADELNDLPWGRAGVAKAIKTRVGVELQIGGFAGNIQVHDDLLIEMKELVPGTVAACLPLAHRFTRVAAQQSGASPTLISPPAALALQFLDSARELFRRGPTKQYFTVTEPSSRLRGRPVLADTITTQWARGRVDKIVQRSRILTLDTPANRLLMAAALRAERLVSTVTGGRDYVKLSRELQRLLVGVSQWSFDDLHSTASTNGDASTLAFAKTLLVGVPYLPREANDEVANAWVNVDQLFEEAVRSVLSELVGHGSVRRGSGAGAQVLRPDGVHGGIYKRADPDIVIHVDDRTIIADAKYRRSRNAVAEGPLYQLLTHSAAFSASRAALIAPTFDGATGPRCLGVDSLGCRVDLVLVDPASNEGLVAPLTAWASDLAVGAGPRPDHIAPGLDATA